MLDHVTSRSGTLRRQWGRSRLRATIALAVGSGLGVVLFAALPGTFSEVRAVDNSGIFELDGNTVQNHAGQNTAPYDWNDLFDASGSPIAGGGGTQLVSSAFASDPTSNDLGFKGSKEFSDISNWTCADHSNPAKDEITNTYAAVFQAANTAGGVTAGDIVVYAGMERASDNGDTNEGIWLFQDPTVHCTATDPTPVPAPGGFAFAGAHQNGDIFVDISFTKGGAVNTIKVYQWPDSTTPIIANAVCGAVANDKACGVVNGGGSITTPWSGTVVTNAFTEVGIDLNQIFNVNNANLPCIGRFQADTRAAAPAGVTSETKDFLNRSLQTCRSTDTGTQLSSASTTVGTPVTDTATVTTPSGAQVNSGTVTFNVYTGTNNTACTGKSVTSLGPINVVNGSAASGAINLPPGNYEVQAVYSGSQAGRTLTSTSACGTEPLTVNQASPNVATHASAATASIGDNLSDVASVTNGVGPADNTPALPAGTVSWSLFGPFPASATLTSSSCDKAHDLTSQLSSGFTHHPADASTSTTATYNSPTFKAPTGGQYVWVASYLGNVNNKAVTNPCADANETTLVNGPSSSLTKGERDLGTSGADNNDAYVTDINPAHTNDVLQYQLIYSNNGNGTANKVVVTDSIPSGSTLVAGSCVPGGNWAVTQCTAAGIIFSSTVPIGANSTGLIAGTFKAKVTATGTFTISNVAGVTSASEADPRSSNTVTAEGVTPSGAVLGISSSNPNTPQSGTPTAAVAGVTAVAAPNTGADIPLGRGLALMILGGALAAIAGRRTVSSRRGGR